MQLTPTGQPTAGASVPTASHSAYKKWIILCVLFINLSMMILVGLSLRSSRLQYERRTSIIAGSLSQILDKTIADEIDKIGMVLLTVADEFDASTGNGTTGGQGLNAFLARYKARLPIVTSLWIADEHGLVRYGSRGIPAPRTNIGDREYFVGPRDNPHAGVFIGQPVFGQIGTKWVLPLSRRLSRPDGTFAGVVCATVEIARFAEIFAVINVGRHGGISLRDDKMGIIARYPSPQDVGSIIGNKTLSPELRKLFEAGKTSGTFFTPTSWDEVPKVVSYRKIAGYPLYINVGIAREDYLSDWRKETVTISALSAFFFSLAFFSAWLIYRSMAAMRKTADALRSAHEGLERKVYERTFQLGLANKGLQEGHSRLIAVLNSIDAIVYVADMETYELLFINNEYEKDRVGDILGGKCWQTLHRGQNGPCAFCTNDKLIGPDGEPTGICRWEYRSPVNGRWYHCRDRAIHWIDGTLKRMTIATDITEHKNMEEELIRAQKLESLGILAGGIAHDFNNLMTSVLGYVGFAMMLLPETHESHRLLENALKSTEQAQDLTGRLITFSRGGFSVRNVSDVSGVLREAVQKKIRGTSVQVTFDIEKDLRPVEVDEAQIRQVFYNLTMNAVEAMPDGGTLTVKAENIEIDNTSSFPPTQGSYLRIIFADTGKGIAEEHLSRIFDPYFSTKDMGDQKGMGLGLSVCYSVLKKHDGHITVTSQPGKGTAFALYLPGYLRDA
jgi:C4-dicarboxylate-specific signal transduction histidine kinase